MSDTPQTTAEGTAGPIDLDPAFVYDGEHPQTFWDNYAYFQSENERKRQEFVDQIAADADAWLIAERDWLDQQQ